MPKSNLFRRSTRRLLGGLMAVLCTGVAHAATWVVDSTSADAGLNACTDAPADCSFPGAISRLAFVGDSIVFTVDSTLATEVVLSRDVTIDAAGARLPRITVATSVGWATVLIRNARWENIASGWPMGGAMVIEPQQIVTIEDSEFRYNRAGTGGKGGAIYNRGHLTVRRTLFEGNYAPSGAGAIYAGAGPTAQVLSSMLIVDSVFRGNGVLDPNGPGRTLGQFGAINADERIVVRGSLFEQNESRYGSAIQSGKVLHIENSTFVGNRTFESTEGGALLLGGPTYIANSTIVGNTGVTGGGLHTYPASDTQLVNTIVADNIGASPDISGRVYSHGYNLIRSRVGAVIDGNPPGTDIYDVDPRLLPLGNYGGPTMTMGLRPDSPALNAGSDCVRFLTGCGGFPAAALADDQRGSGFPRMRAGSVDIGAFELASELVSNHQDNGTGSLRQAISDAQAGDVITFSPSHFNQPRTIPLQSTLVVNKTLGIVGPGSTLLTLDANNQRRHLNVDAPATLTLSGLRFTRGNPGVNVGGGAILVNLGTLNASEIHIEDSIANGGGCIYNNGTLELSRARLSGCQASYSAGLFNETGRTATIRDTRIENNIATGPGGGIGNPSGATLVLERVSLSGNQGMIGGGLNSYGTATLTNTTFSGNTAENGGGMYLGGAGTTTLTHSTVTGNTAQLNGGIAAEFDSTVNLRSNVIAENTRTVDQAPDAGGFFISFGHNLIGDTSATVFRPGSPSLVGNLLDVAPRLDVLADNGGHSLTHAPRYDSPLIDAGASGLTSDARGLGRPVNFTHLSDAAGGNGSDIGAFELQVATPTNVVATPAIDSLLVSFDGGARGGAAIGSYRVTCGAQTADGTASPIMVMGLTAGVATTCTVTAFSGALSGIPSAPSNSAAPALLPGAPIIGTAVAGNGQVNVAFTAPASDGGSPITGYTATCGTRSASGSASPISVIGLINGASASCSVRATNAVGSGPASALSNSVTPGLPGAYAVVADGGTNAAVISLSDNVVVASIPLISSQTGVAVSPDGSRVYLVSQGTDEVTVINTQTNSVVTRIPVPNRPWSAVVSPDSSLVYVTQSSGSEVSVISAASNTVIGTIPGITSGYGIAITPDGERLYVAPAGGAFVYAVNTATYATQTIGVGLYPIGVATSADGTRAYVTAVSGNSLTVIDTATATPIATIPVGAGPQGVTVSPNSTRVYVANSNAGTVSVIDAASLSVMATVPVGGRPQGVDVSPDNASIYVVDQANARVGVIEATSNMVVGTIQLGGGGAMFSMGDFMVVAGVAPVITSGAPADGLVGAPYSHSITASGVPAPSFALISGALPAGLSLDPATGIISGTPTAVGAAVGAVVRASNGVGNPVTQTISMTIDATIPDPPTITGVSAGDGSVTVSFTPPSNDGGSPIFMYNAFCGGIGSSRSESPITVTGLPNGVAVTCQANSVNGVGGGFASPASDAVTPGVAPTFTSGPPPSGTFGAPYLHVLTAQGAPAPDFALLEGSLPTGLSIDTASGSISGTPSSVGTFSGSFSASNGIGSAAVQAFSITIGPGLPDAPTNVVATRGNGEVSVAFTAPVNSGGVSLLGFRADCAGQMATSTASPITVPGLVNGTPVNCTVVAVNEAGDSAPSLPSNSVTPAAPQTIQFGEAPVILLGGTGNVTASGGGSGNPVLFASITPDVCTSSGDNGAVVTGLAVGTCTITADQEGNAAWLTAPQATQSFVIVAVYTVTPTAGSGGSIDPSTPQTIMAGEAATFTVTPLPGYLATVAGSCGGSLAGSTYTTAPISNDCTVLASFATVPDAPVLISATAGDAQVSVAFLPSPNDGGAPIISYTARCGTQDASGASSPLTVSGLVNGVAVTCSVIARNSVGDSAASEPSASVTPRVPDFAVTVTRAGAGLGGVTSTPAGIDCGSQCTARFIADSALLLVALPEPGSRFSHWSGACTGTQNNCSLTVDQDLHATAHFDPLVTVLVQVDGGGRVTSAPSGIDCGNTCMAGFAPDTQVTLTAIASSGWSFDGWVVDCVGNLPDCVITTSQPRNVGALFTQPGSIFRSGFEQP